MPNVTNGRISRLSTTKFQEWLAGSDKGTLTVDCWIWQGKLNKGGYGLYRGLLCHRISFFWANGYLPTGKGQLVMHTCHQKRCCNPKHLKHGDNWENSRDSDMWYWDGKTYQNKANYHRDRRNG